MNIRTESKLLRTAVLLSAALLALGTARAQDQPPTPPPDAQQGQMQGPPPGGPRGGMDPRRRLEMLKHQLNLSEDQTAQIKTIFENERTQSEALRADTTATREQIRPKMEAIRKDSETKLEAVLTPDQKTKYAEIRAHERERGPGRQGPPPDGAAPPPPPQQ